MDSFGIEVPEIMDPWNGIHGQRYRGSVADIDVDKRV